MVECSVHIREVRGSIPLLPIIVGKGERKLILRSIHYEKLNGGKNYENAKRNSI